MPDSFSTAGQFEHGDIGLMAIPSSCLDNVLEGALVAALRGRAFLAPPAKEG
jgi:hypothetical protein